MEDVSLKCENSMKEIHVIDPTSREDPPPETTCEVDSIIIETPLKIPGVEVVNIADPTFSNNPSQTKTKDMKERVGESDPLSLIELVSNTGNLSSEIKIEPTFVWAPLSPRTDNIFQIDLPLKEEVPAPNQVENSHRQPTTRKKKELVCLDCGKIFHRKRNLKIHHIRIHSDTLARSCEKCGEKFKYSEDFKRHMNRHEEKESSRNEKSPRNYLSRMRERQKLIRNGVKESDYLLIKNGKFFCKVCGNNYSGKHSVFTHYLCVHMDTRDFPCKLCSSKFKMYKVLRRHIKLVHQKGLFPPKKEPNISCKECGKKFSRNHSLKLHYTQNHTNEYKFPCGQCDKKYKLKRHLVLHMRVHDPRGQLYKMKRRVTCDECGKMYANKLKVRDHIIRMHTDGFDFCCQMCDKKYKLLNDLKQHIKINHGKPSTKTRKNPIESLSERNAALSAELGKMICKFCNVQFKNSERLREHIVCKDTLGAPFPCEVCGKTYKSREDLNCHMKRIHDVEEPLETEKVFRETQTEFFCDYCSYEFSLKRNLSCHIIRKHMDPQFNCEECSQRFHSDGSLKRHMKIHQSLTKSPEEKQKISCEICGMEVKDKYALKYHHIRRHTQKFEFPCKTCDKVFKLRGDLTRHMRLTHLEPPAICDVCGIVMKNKRILALHRRYKHFPTEFWCNICKKCLSSQDRLDKHLRESHKLKERVTCDDCGKTYANKSNLRGHFFYAHGDFPSYGCELCGKSYSRKNKLTEHLRIHHSGQNPYTCDICGKEYKTKPSFFNHKKQHLSQHPPLC